MTKAPHLIFMITERCNCNCFFCSRNNLHASTTDPSLEQLIKAFNILYNEYPLSKLILSGGEPTLSKHFTEIVAYTTDLYKKVEIQSNGTLSTPIVDYIRPYMKKKLHLQVSLDGIAEFHNQIRGKNVFNQAINVIQSLDDVHDHITISMTVTPRNFQYSLKLAQELNDLRFRKLKVSIVHPQDPSTEELITNKEWNEFVDTLLPLCYYPVDISKLFDFEMMDDFLESGRIWNGTTNCGRGETHMYIQSNFNVLPCTCIPNSVGNLLEDNIGNIKERLAKSNDIVVSKESVCYTCKYRSICNGGCPGYSIKVFGKLGMGDIRCPIVRSKAAEMGLL